MKQKTSSSAKKRFRKTGSGRLVAEKSARNHLLMNKNTRQKNLFSKSRHMPVHASDINQVYRLLPHVK